MKRKEINTLHELESSIVGVIEYQLPETRGSNPLSLAKSRKNCLRLSSACQYLPIYKIIKGESV